MINYILWKLLKTVYSVLNIAESLSTFYSFLIEQIDNKADEYRLKWIQRKYIEIEKNMGKWCEDNLEFIYKTDKNYRVFQCKTPNHVSTLGWIFGNCLTNYEASFDYTLLVLIGIQNIQHSSKNYHVMLNHKNEPVACFELQKDYIGQCLGKKNSLISNKCADEMVKYLEHKGIKYNNLLAVKDQVYFGIAEVNPDMYNFPPDIINGLPLPPANEDDNNDRGRR